MPVNTLNIIMMKKLYKIIYSVLYNIFVLYELIQEYWKNLKKQFHNITPNDFAENGFDYLKKKPIHISFIIDEEPSFKDLANVVSWCFLVKISFVSFYDYRGILEKNLEKLEMEINELKNPNDHILWYNKKTDFKNGIIGRKIHLKIITKEDGKNNVEKICRNFIIKKEEISKINISHVDKCLKEKYVFPDPDVGVIFSKIFSLFEYPPWEIRLTEFFRINSHHNLIFSDFISVLEKYSKCNQRLGT